jgi:hypothetical protein
MLFDTVYTYVLHAVVFFLQFCLYNLVQINLNLGYLRV